MKSGLDAPVFGGKKREEKKLKSQMTKKEIKKDRKKQKLPGQIDEYG